MSLIDPQKIPSGLSWGTRGFRIGKSVSGNWWISLGLPFGFRYTWMLGKNKSRKNQEEYTSEIPEPIENQTPINIGTQSHQTKSKIIKK